MSTHNFKMHSCNIYPPFLKHVTGCDVSKCNNNSTTANFKLSLSLTGKSIIKAANTVPQTLYNCRAKLCPVKPVPNMLVHTVEDELYETLQHVFM